MLKKLEKILDKRIIVLSVIAALTLAIYINGISGPFVLDDYGNISNNYSIRKPWDLPAMWNFYANRVIIYITFSINYFIHDNGTEGYRIVNYLIHIFNGFFVFLIFNLLLGLQYFKEKVTGRYRNVISLLCALIFISHPIQVNAVTYIVQRTASLASMFYFLAVLFYLKFRIFDKIRYFFLVMLFTVLAMFTKENTITIPFLLLVIELLFFMKDGKTSWKKRILFLLIIFATVVIVPGTKVFLHGYSQSDPGISFKASTNMDRMTYFYTQLNVIVLYIQRIIIPDVLNFDYSNDFPLSKTLWDNHSYASLAVLLIIGFIALLKVRKNKLISLGILWFFIGLSVESSFISIKDVYFEHRLYFPLVGFLMCMTGICFSEFRKFKRPYLIKKPMLYFLVLSMAMILSYSAVTIKRNYIFSNEIRLWSDVAEKAPMSDRAHSVLGASYLNAAESSTGDKKNSYLNLAQKELEKAIELYKWNSTAHSNLARVFLLQKNYDKCIKHANTALGLNKTAHPYNTLGLCYKEMGRFQEAIEYLLSGYEIDNKSWYIIKNLGYTYYETKDYKNAVKYFEEYLKYYKNKSVKDDLKKAKELMEKA